MNARGYFGAYGGRFVPETLVEPLRELEEGFRGAREDRTFRRELRRLLRTYAGRPTPLYHARRLSAHVGGAQIHLKREDLLHGGAHKINNALGQALLAKRLGRRRLIAETGAGQHGVATAMAGAAVGLRTEVYMGTDDMERQRPNVDRMQLLGARVRPVEAGSRTLKDAINEALRDWAATPRTTHYCVGSVVGPHPYPWMVREFQSVIGKELTVQLRASGLRAHAIVACVGGGSNAAGTFSAFAKQRTPALIGVEAGGGRNGHAATINRGRPGILHGARSYLLQDPDGQVAQTHSVSAGLDYPGVGPEHSFWADAERVTYVEESDAHALDAFHLLAKTEGILPALESAHAVARAIRLARSRPRREHIVITLSGRGDKDLATVLRSPGRAA